MLFESETTKRMPPNEIDDIWMEDKSVSEEIYHGHIFLIGLQKLRILAKLAGFKIQEIKYVRLSKGSLFLFLLFYPLILISSYLRYHRRITSYNVCYTKLLRSAVHELGFGLAIGAGYLRKFAELV